jgi:hypothetical protein
LPPRRAKALYTQKRTASGQYTDCLQAHNQQPNLIANIPNGAATLTTSWNQAPGPFVQTVQASVFFKAPFHQDIMLTSLTNILVLITSPPAPQQVNVTITLNGVSTGSYDPGNGFMSLTLPLHFHYDVAIPDDNIVFFLDTAAASGGFPMDAFGTVTLAGSGTFTDGFLAGNGFGSPSQPQTANLIVTATIVPHPYVA